jgi:hypothetical protein
MVGAERRRADGVNDSVHVLARKARDIATAASNRRRVRCLR